MPGVGRRELRMAVGGLLYRQSAFGGGATGRNPTDRGKADSKKSILVDAAGGPLSVAAAGANVHDTKMLRPTLESMVVRARKSRKTCAWTKGMTTPQATGPLPPTRTVRIFGALGRRSGTNWAKNLPGPTVGGRTHPGLAVQMPSHIGALRQEADQFPGPASISLCPHLVPSSTPPRGFEIVSKGDFPTTKTAVRACIGPTSADN